MFVYKVEATIIFLENPSFYGPPLKIDLYE
jgi:hypothetical protein